MRILSVTWLAVLFAVAGCSSGVDSGGEARNLPNQVPVADAGRDKSEKTGTQVSLDGRESRDDDGDAITYAWFIESLPEGSASELYSPSSSTPRIDLDVDGRYVIGLAVSDGQSTSQTDFVEILANAGNSPPVAHAGADQNVLPASTVVLDGSASSDADGDPLSFAWLMTSKPAGSTATMSNATTSSPNYVADVAGTYTADLVVHDGQSASEPDSVTVTAVDGNYPPEADAGEDQSSVVGSRHTLSGAGSSDANGDPLSYHWRVVSKPQNSNASLSDAARRDVSITTDSVGTYSIELRVSDGQLSDVDIVNIEATETIRYDQGRKPPECRYLETTGVATC